MAQVEVRVNGMHCGACENAVGKAVSALAGVRSVSADHATGRVSIDVEGSLDRDSLSRAVTDAGYELVPA